MLQRRWEELGNRTQQLSVVANALDCYLKQNQADHELQRALVQLSLMHRRVVRQLNEMMERTSEDLTNVDQGAHRLQRIREFNHL